MKEFDDLVKFVELIHDFRKIERQIYNQGKRTLENDVEHSYQLAIVGWYLVSSRKWPFDANKVLKYGLAHDLVEIYAGDVPAYHRTAADEASKKEREHQALLRLEKEYPDFSDLIETIKAYEARQDEESKFVYALDKLLATLNNFLEGGQIWKDRKVALQDVIDFNINKVTVSVEINTYFDYLITKLKEREAELFNIK